MFFFFQAEDGIRDLYVTGVQTVLFRSPRPRLLLSGRAVLPALPAARLGDPPGRARHQLRGGDRAGVRRPPPARRSVRVRDRKSVVEGKGGDRVGRWVIEEEMDDSVSGS